MAGITSYSPEVAERFLELLSSGMSLRDIRSITGMPSTKTVRKWKAEVEGFAEAYNEARKQSGEELEDETLNLARDLKNKEQVPVVMAKFGILRWVASKRDQAYGNNPPPPASEPIKVIGGLPDELIGMDKGSNA